MARSPKHFRAGPQGHRHGDQQKAGDLSSLKTGDRVTLDYDPEQEVVTHLADDAKAHPLSLLDEWVFHDVLGNGVTEQQSLDRTTEPGVLIIPSRTGQICLNQRLSQIFLIACEKFQDVYRV